MRIAIASSDGVNVDLHFGKANSIYVYDVDEDKPNYIEHRSIIIEENKRHQWRKIIDNITDCDVVICVQAGFKSKIGIEEKGIKLVEDEGPLNDVLEKYIKHYNFMKKPI